MGSQPYFIPEKEIKNAPISIPLKSFPLITNQSENNILKIVNKNNEKGTGFFCLIPFPDKLHPLSTLITNNHVLDENDIEIGNTLKFSSENTAYQILIDNERKCYTNEDYDTTIIEIKNEDKNVNTNKFLEIDDDIFNNNANEIFRKASIYIMHYPSGDQNKISFGVNKGISIDNINILHQTRTLAGSSGGPIMNLINYKVIGIHKGAEVHKDLNLGTLLKLPIEKFNEKFYRHEEVKDGNNNIMTKNEFSIFNDDIEEDIYLDNKNKIEGDKIENDEIIIKEDSSAKDNYENINSQSVNKIENNNIEEIKNIEELNNNMNIIESNILNNNNYINNDEINNEKNIVDEITIIYSKENLKQKNFLDKLRYKMASSESFSENKLFGENFVKNNINNCKIIINGKQYNLASYINEEYNENIYLLELKLKGVSKIINMSTMFFGCLSLTAVPDIDKLNTENIIYMNNIFTSCESLISLPDISKWNVSRVITISHIFQFCLLLTSLPDISKWDTSNVIDMTHAFCHCERLSSLPDISNWDTSKTVSFMFMFEGCDSLRTLPDISKWNTSKVKDMQYMFGSCKNLNSLPDISKWNTCSLQNTSNMFYACSSLQSLPDISRWNTKSLINIEHMFSRCRADLNIPERFKKCHIF